MAKDVNFKKLMGRNVDPNKLGRFADDIEISYVFWVIFFGKNITDCSFHRYFVSNTNGKVTPPPPPQVDFKPNAKIHRGQGDGPTFGQNLLLFPNLAFAVIADAPGVTVKSLSLPGHLPYQSDRNFAIDVFSESDHSAKAHVWYDYHLKINIQMKPTENDVTLTASEPPVIW